MSCISGVCVVLLLVLSNLFRGKSEAFETNPWNWNSPPAPEASNDRHSSHILAQTKSNRSAWSSAKEYDFLPCLPRLHLSDFCNRHKRKTKFSFPSFHLCAERRRWHRPEGARAGLGLGTIDFVDVVTMFAVIVFFFLKKGVVFLTNSFTIKNLGLPMPTFEK